MDIGHYPLDRELEIPLQTEATPAGIYTFTVTDLAMDGVQLYLNDTETGNSLFLEEVAHYEFTINQTAKAPADPFALLVGGDLRKKMDSSSRFTISTERLESNDRETANSLALNQNYPNPFNPTTQIPFELPESIVVQLEVFDYGGPAGSYAGRRTCASRYPRSTF